MQTEQKRHSFHGIEKSAFYYSLKTHLTNIWDCGIIDTVINPFMILMKGYNPMSVMERASDALYASITAHVLKRTESGRPLVVDVSGSEATTNRVSIIRNPHTKTVSLSCHKVGRDGVATKCWGNEKTVCWHCLQALYVVAYEQGIQLVFLDVDTLKDAKKLPPLKNSGQIFVAQFDSEQGGKSVFAIAQRVGKPDKWTGRPSHRKMFEWFAS